MDWSVNVILDEDWVRGRSLVELTERIIAGGATFLQYRNKTDETGDFYRKANSVFAVASRQGIPLIINDRLDIALAVNADGIHVGQNDLPVDVIRRHLGPEKIVGLSVSTLAHVENIHGADYLGVGSVFPTRTKTGVRIGGLDLVRKIRSRTAIPFVGIGGIDAENADQAIEAGCDGVSVISAVLASEDVEQATRNLLQAVQKAKIG